MRIQGMHCDGCASRIQKLLESEPGIRGLTVSYAEKEARVRFNPHATGQDRIAEIVQRAGFDVTATE
jgi:copper chaperone